MNVTPLTHLFRRLSMLLWLTVLASPAGRLAATGVDFANDIQPIFNHYCIACHDGSYQYDLTTGFSYADIVNNPGTRKYASYRVLPDFADITHSAVYYVLVYLGSGNQHQGNSWVATTADKTTLTNWINQGALPDLSAPTLTSVSPSSGGVSGGTTVTLTGTAFGGTGIYAPVVKFGGVPATNVVVTTGSFTQITCKTPAGTAGTVDVVVSTTAGGSSAALTNAFTFASGPPSKLAFGVQPSSATAGTSLAPAVTVQIQDAQGNPTTSTADVVLAMGSNPGGSTLSGTTTVTAVAGTATFSNLSLNRAGIGYTLSASSTTLTGTTSNAFNINATRPTVTSATSTAIGSSAATLGGNVTGDGGGTITNQGVVFARTSVNSSPQLAGTGVTNVAAGTSGTGIFTTGVTGLAPETNYSFAAYAANSAGTSYSSTGTFKTLSNNAALSGLSLSAGTLNPVFDSATTTYSMYVPNTTLALTVTPTVANSAATVQVNGTPVASGTASGAISLAVGSNPVTTMVTAQDGTTKTYTVPVIRASTASATLASLLLDSGSLSPIFDSATAGYTVSVPNSTASITLSPGLTDPAASVTVNSVSVASGSASAAIPLNSGSNVIILTVTSSDATSFMTYTVTVTRASSSNAALSSLAPDAGTLSPAFDGSVTSYSMSVPQTTKTISFTPGAAEMHASITVNGTTAASSSASSPVSLMEGDNVIIIRVTAQDGITVITYTVAVHRAIGGVPRIVSQPAPQFVAPGSAATFNVSAVGADTLTYQWRKNGINIALATASSYSITTVQTTDAAAYSVKVTNSLGSATSDAAALTVAKPGIVGLPQIDTQPLPVLVALGQTATFTASASGAATLSYQWRKSTAAIAGATSTTYTTLPTTLTSAGNYNLMVKNLQGSVVSASARLGVVSLATKTVPAKTGTIVTLTVPAAGDSLLYQWRKDGAEISDSTSGTHSISGTNAASLVIKTASTADTGSYTCVVRMGALSRESGASKVEVYDTVPAINLATNAALPAGIVSGTYLYQMPVDPGSTRAVVTFGATPLPAGLRIDPATGLISGRPTVASPVGKPFSITFSATNAIGKASVVVLLTISPLPVATVGTFNGLVDRDADPSNGLSANAGKNISFGGSLNLTTLPTGVFSGKLTLGTLSYSFVNQFVAAVIGANPTAEVTIPRTLPLLNLTLAFTINKDTGELTGTVTDGIFGTPVSVHAWRGTAPLAALVGSYTSVLDITPGQTPDPTGNLAYPQGYGFGTLTVYATGSATWTGKLSDGSTMTANTTVGTTGQIPLHLMLYSTPGSAHGWVQVSLDSTSTPTNAGQPLLDGGLDWVKDAQAPSSTNHNYKAGFGLHQLTAAGGKYVKPTTTVLGIVDQVSPTNARLAFSDGGLTGPPPIVGASMATNLNTNTPFRITNANAVIMPIGASTNPATLTLALTASSGAFSGSFILKNDPDPTDHVPPTALLSRTVYYYGLIVQRLSVNKALGFFLLSELPADATLTTPKTTLATSDILSGRVELEAK